MVHFYYCCIQLLLVKVIIGRRSLPRLISKPLTTYWSWISLELVQPGYRPIQIQNTLNGLPIEHTSNHVEETIRLRLNFEPLHAEEHYENVQVSSWSKNLSWINARYSTLGFLLDRKRRRLIMWAVNITTRRFFVCIHAIAGRQWHTVRLIQSRISCRPTLRSEISLQTRTYG